jgi:hypothetical protein
MELGKKGSPRLNDHFLFFWVQTAKESSNNSTGTGSHFSRTFGLSVLKLRNLTFYGRWAVDVSRLVVDARNKKTPARPLVLPLGDLQVFLSNWH